MCISNCAPVKYSLAFRECMDPPGGCGDLPAGSFCACYDQWVFNNGTGIPPSCTNSPFTSCTADICCFGDQCNGWQPTLTQGQR